MISSLVFDEKGLLDASRHIFLTSPVLILSIFKLLFIINRIIYKKKVKIPLLLFYTLSIKMKK